MYAMIPSRDPETVPEGTIVNEMLRCDVYDIPPEASDESAFRISPAYAYCPYCSRIGESLADIQHYESCPLAHMGEVS